MSEIQLEPRKEIHWDRFWLFQSAVFSLRSHDVHTQCGCVLVRDNLLISAGYNGFVRGHPDHNPTLPLTRPDKYKYMVHSEQNAIYNAARKGLETAGATAYISGRPCLTCLQALWQAGIERFYWMGDYSIPSRVQNEEWEKDFERLREMLGFDYFVYDKKQVIDTFYKFMGCYGVPFNELAEKFSSAK